MVKSSLKEKLTQAETDLEFRQIYVSVASFKKAEKDFDGHLSKILDTLETLYKDGQGL